MPHFECWARIASDGRAHASSLVPIPPTPTPTEQLNTGILSTKPSSYYSNPFARQRQEASQRQRPNTFEATLGSDAGSPLSTRHGSSDAGNVLKHVLSHPPLIADFTSTTNPLDNLTTRGPRTWAPSHILPSMPRSATPMALEPAGSGGSSFFSPLQL
ncbi:hypothetical protein BCR44DRAFT_1499057 [Catenaria anguillulae PL171]|uniref:Uncharacterized protein n=1 Tax=Catenaria anguillulae PL171 TaxID=765915 RepID=A0A1Y2HNK9_9FUNG|nr:hypothetical protein BCR44DRAFT_1499057 [Catenaria anguillulae PL171]